MTTNRSTDIHERDLRRLGAERTRLQLDLAENRSQLQRTIYELYVQHGYSGRELAKLCDVSNMIVSKWLRDIDKGLIEI